MKRSQDMKCFCRPFFQKPWFFTVKMASRKNLTAKEREARLTDSVCVCMIFCDVSVCVIHVQLWTSEMSLFWNVLRIRIFWTSEMFFFFGLFRFWILAAKSV